MKQTTAMKNEKDADNSYASPYRCSAMTTKLGTPPQTFSTPLPEQFMVASSSQDRMTKPHRPPGEQSSMESCKSSGTTSIFTPSTTQAYLPAVRPRQTWTSCSSSETQRYSQFPSRNLTSFGHREQLHHTNRTQGRHPQTSTITHACPPPRSWKNLGLYLGTTGTETLKGWRHNTIIRSRGWEEDQWTLPSIGTTSFLTIPSSSSHEDTTAPATRVHSE
jgi:hypothetical protein